MSKHTSTHPYGWRDCRHRSVSYIEGSNPNRIDIKRPDGRYCSFANLHVMAWTSSRQFDAPAKKQHIVWRRAMYWSMPIVDLAEKLVNNTATVADVAQLRDYLAKVRG
jgi:hypothetical protein